MIYNRDELYVPIPPFTLAWHRHIAEQPGHAGPFADSYPALRAMISIGVAMRHNGHWLRFLLTDGYDTVIAGYSRFPYLQVAVNPKALRPVRFDSDEDRVAYDDWAAMMTNYADRLALAPYEEES